MGPLMIDIEGDVLAAPEADLFRHPAVGGIILFSRNYRSPRQMRSLVAAVRSAAGRPVVVAIDQEGGRVQRMRTGFTTLPPARVLGEAHDSDPGRARELACGRGRLLALELGAVDIDFSFAPVVDLDYGRSEVIGNRALHGDPEVVAALGEAFVQGASSAGMACVAKHFPGHGWVAADSHAELPVDGRDYSELRADMAPFERLIGAGISAVMTAHVQYPSVDDPTPCYSPRWIRKELRQRLNFSGAVFADDLSMHGAGQAGDLGQRVAASLEAGCDMLPICNDPEGVRELLGDWRYAAGPGSAARLARLRRSA